MTSYLVIHISERIAYDEYYVIGIFEVASAWRINSSSAFLGVLRKTAPTVNVLLLHSSILFLKFEHGQIIIYAQNSFLYLRVWWLFLT